VRSRVSYKIVVNKNFKKSRKNLGLFRNRIPRQRFRGVEYVMLIGTPKIPLGFTCYLAFLSNPKFFIVHF